MRLTHPALCGMFAFSLACTASVLGSQPAPSFQGTGFLGGGSPVFSYTQQISDDGQMAIGSSNSSVGQVGFRWTPTAGIQSVPFPPGSGNSAQGVNGVTADGAVIVGGAYGDIPFSWTAATGSVPLSHTTATTAECISPNGQYIGGYAAISGSTAQEVVTWDATGMHDTGIQVPNPNYRLDVSNSGVFVGIGSTGSGEQAFMGSIASGFSFLGVGTVARDISEDSRTIVGSINTPDGKTVAARWTSATGWVSLGSTFPGYGSGAYAVSGDGSIVVGATDSPTGGQVFVWDSTNGERLLADMLANDGVSTVGWTLEKVADVSANGSYLVESGTDPSGKLEGWVATIPVPEPATAGVLALVALGFLRERRVSPVSTRIQLR